jgi:spermidine synthase
MPRALDAHAAFLAAGLLATAAQSLLLRELVVDAAGDEAAIGVGLAAWLAGIAAGAAVARRRAPVAPRRAGLGLALLAALAPVALLGGRLLRAALAPDPGELPGPGTALALSLATLALPGVAVGATFTALAATAARAWPAGEAVRRVYVVESLGSLAGGLAVTFLAGTHVLPARLCALAAAAGLLVSLRAPHELAAARSPRLVALGFALALAVVAPPLDRATERARFAATAPGVALRATADTPLQHLAIGGEDVRHLYASGRYAASFPEPYAAETRGALLAVLAPRLERVLLLGGLESGLVPVLCRHGAQRLTLVDPDPHARQFLRPWLPATEAAALDDPRVTVVTDDPRRFASRPSSGRFDLVVLPSAAPDTLRQARLATVEFFRQVGARLAPDGVLVMGLQTAPTAASGDTAALAGVLVRTLREAFAVVRVTPGPDSLVVASADPRSVSLDPGVLAARWRERSLDSPAFDAALLGAILDPDRVATGEAAIARAAAASAVSVDDRPLCFLHALARGHRERADRWGGIVAAAARAGPSGLASLALLLAGAIALRAVRPPRHPTRTRRVASFVVAVVGAAGMGWSLVLLFAFQTHAGALHGALGALVAVFMLGLAAGGALAPRSSVALPACLGAAALVSGLLPLALGAAALAAARGPRAALLAYAALLLATGAATGSVFPAAVAARLGAGDEARDAAGSIETADHAGAAVAALLGAVLFVPLLGLAGTALLLAALLGVAFAATLTLSPRGRT